MLAGGGSEIVSVPAQDGPLQATLPESSLPLEDKPPGQLTKSQACGPDFW